ncbi:MAG: quinolinate synthase NadA [Deltaproteobacteria bacterium]|nr:quinolinate synthase NadA [Deltaproteobacteria bacterium]
MIPTNTAYTAAVAHQTEAIYRRIAHVVERAEWEEQAPLVAEINALKAERNAVILAHNYMASEIFYGVADLTGDSLALAKRARNSDAEVIVVAGVHFMAETAKLLNPQKRVLISEPAAGCSLAEAITPQDVRTLRERYPGVPIVAYVNTPAAVKAEVDVCCTSGNAVQLVKALAAPRVIVVPDEYLGLWIAEQLPEVEVITFDGHCEVHQRFSGQQVRALRADHPGVVVLAHPECSPEVTREADFVGSTAAMEAFVDRQRPGKLLMLTECSMSDNVAGRFPKIEFVRPCTLCPHMKRITLENLRDALRELRYEVVIAKELAVRARRSVERMFELVP